MKSCPQCDRSFADSQDACDFDGTSLVEDPLVDDPKPLPVSLVVSKRPSTTQSSFLRLLKSPVFLTVLLVAAVLSSLLLIVYYGAKQPNTIAERRAPQDSVSQVPPAQPAAQDKTQAPSTSPNEVSTASTSRDTRKHSVTTSRSRARLRTSPSRNQTKPEIARQRQPKDKSLQTDSKDNPNRKESKLTAALKTTWNILKKPFKF